VSFTEALLQVKKSGSKVMGGKIVRHIRVTQDVQVMPLMPPFGLFYVQLQICYLDLLITPEELVFLVHDVMTSKIPPKILKTDV